MFLLIQVLTTLFRSNILHIILFFQVNFKHMSIEELEDLLEERPDVFELKQSLMEKYCLIGVSFVNMFHRYSYCIKIFLKIEFVYFQFWI